MEVSTAPDATAIIYAAGSGPSVSKSPNRLAVGVVLAGIDVDVKLRLPPPPPPSLPKIPSEPAKRSREPFVSSKLHQIHSSRNHFCPLRRRCQIQIKINMGSFFGVVFEDAEDFWGDVFGFVSVAVVPCLEFGD